ncbi:MAG TPA: PrgI family protein [Candidatus Saccharimonadales bacterium]|nr:PrgI family protein [Candidatus Saccharimonadales bacterium]
MATYKVIQDIEAEDKLLGPLTFRQFVYAGACILFLYLTYLSIAKGGAFMAVVFLPLAALCGFFAWPWSRDQPTEVWALAKIRFLVKPRRRIWSQSGTKELVTITAPKQVQAIYTNGLSQDEVQSRLRALAETIDSRGWVVKNVNVNMFGQPTSTPPSDRLVGMSSIPEPVQDVDIQAQDDMLEESNPIAKQFDTMIEKSTQARREDILNQLKSAGATPSPQLAQQSGTPSAGSSDTQQGANGQPAANYWFLNQPSAGSSVTGNAVTFNTQVVTPGVPATDQPAPTADVSVDDEQAIMQQLKQQEQREAHLNPYANWHNIKPISAEQQANAAAQASQMQQPMQAPYPGYGVPAGGQTQPQPTIAQPPVQQMTPPPDPAILQLASNDDLDVATIARQANRHKEELQDEVVISLH